jgi:hypothetical protein
MAGFALDPSSSVARIEGCTEARLVAVVSAAD